MDASITTRRNALELFIWYGDERTFLLCSGEVDVSTAGRLREAADVSLRPRPSMLCIDGCGITFFSAAGVDALVDAVALCSERDVQVELALSPVAERVVRLCGADLLLHLDEPTYEPSGAPTPSDDLRAT